MRYYIVPAETENTESEELSEESEGKLESNSFIQPSQILDESHLIDGDVLDLSNAYGDAQDKTIFVSGNVKIIGAGTDKEIKNLTIHAASGANLTIENLYLTGSAGEDGAIVSSDNFTLTLNGTNKISQGSATTAAISANVNVVKGIGDIDDKLILYSDGCCVLGDAFNATGITLESIVEIVETKVEAETLDASDITEDLTASGFDTVAKVETTLKDALKKLNSDISDKNMAFYDLQLYYRDGDQWLPAKEEHFPENGELFVSIPAPAGTSADVTYYGVHMFSEDAFGNEAGGLEVLTIESHTDGDGQLWIDFYVTGVSPVIIGWAETSEDENDTADPNDKLPATDNHQTGDNNPDSPQTGDNSYMALWFALLFISGGLKGHRH